MDSSLISLLSRRIAGVRRARFKTDAIGMVFASALGLVPDGKMMMSRVSTRLSAIS